MCSGSFNSIVSFISIYPNADVCKLNKNEESLTINFSFLPVDNLMNNLLYGDL